MASFKGKARKHGRRWGSFDAHGKRGKRYYLVLGDFKLQDILTNARAEEISRLLRRGYDESQYEPSESICKPFPYHSCTTIPTDTPSDS